MTAPVPVPVPGAGQLGERERVLTARVHAVVGLTADTVLVKALSPDSVPRFLAGEVSAGSPGARPPFDYRLVGGTVARKQDCARFRAPEDFRQAFRLDYPGSPFPAGLPVLHLMEFPAVDPDWYVVPFGAPTAPGVPVSAVRSAAYAMVASARAAGVDPGTVRMEIAPWPYAGTGLTAGGAMALPEWWKRPGLVPRGAVITSHDGGPPRVVAEYRGAREGWRQP